MTVLDFPAWLRVTHWLNVLFLTLLVRSGIEIMATHPKLYWRNDSAPGTEWASFTRKTMPTEKLYDTLDQEESYSPILSLPGRKQLGMGRHWHFVTVLAWITTGLVYVVLLFATGQWHRYIPYSWSIFPTAWEDILSYLSFRLPPLLPGEPLDALQKLAYAAVIFLLSPFTILTGAAQSPAIEARFPWYVRLWGGRQAARSLHFLSLVAFLAFLVVHLLMIAVWGWPQLNSSMIFGTVRNLNWAVAISVAIVVLVVLANVAATVASLRRPRQVQRGLGAVITAVRKILLRPLTSRQHYSRAEISAQHRVNGKPPGSDRYQVLAAHRFRGWTLQVGGLVERPMSFTLDELRGLRDPQTQRVLHNCIQGWSSVGEWGGVPLADVVALVRPLPQARYLCLLSMQDVGRDDASAEGAGRFYEVIDLSAVDRPQVILAYEMNGEPLPIQHGAPLRLRIETQVGFKMTKWVERIEVVSAYSGIGEGMGGWREDNVFYDKEAEI